jgi:uncharacterized membrane protein
MSIYQFFLFLHIVAGTLGLISGTINSSRKKGDYYHRLIGKIFFYSMLVVGTSSFVLSILRFNHFLFIVGVFTLYMVATGQRYLYLKELRNSQQPKWIDWGLTGFMFVFGWAFIGFGSWNLFQKTTFGIVYLVFGYLGLKMVWTDLQNYRGKSDTVNYWLIAHLQRMMGAYAAAITAFLVVNNTFFPDYVAYLFPLLLFVPLITFWKKKYRVKAKKA